MAVFAILTAFTAQLVMAQNAEAFSCSDQACIDKFGEEYQKGDEETCVYDHCFGNECRYVCA